MRLHTPNAGGAGLILCWGTKIQHTMQHSKKIKIKKSQGCEFQESSAHHLLAQFLACNCCCCPVSQSYPTLCDPTDCSTPGFPVLPYLPEFTQTDIHWVSETIQPSHPLSSPSPPALSLSQHQGLFQWARSSQQVKAVLELQFQRQCYNYLSTIDIYVKR